MRETGLRDADQRDVWQDIDAKVTPNEGRLGDTRGGRDVRALAVEAGRVRRGRSRPCRARLVRVFTINGIVAGLDVFDSPATWRKSMRKLVQSYGLDALDNAGGLVPDAKPQPEVFLSALKQASRDRFPAIGVGEDVRIAGDTIVGGGLVVDGKVVHLVAFPASADAVPQG